MIKQLFLLNCDFNSQACISLMFIYLGRCLIPTSKPTDILKGPNKTQNLKVFAMFVITYGINGCHNFVHCSHPSVEIHSADAVCSTRINSSLCAELPTEQNIVRPHRLHMHK